MVVCCKPSKQARTARRRKAWRVSSDNWRVLGMGKAMIPAPSVTTELGDHHPLKIWYAIPEARMADFVIMLVAGVICQEHVMNKLEAVWIPKVTRLSFRVH